MLFNENVRVKIKVSRMISRGRERGRGDWRRAIELIGMVRAQIQRVNVIRGADRWSSVKSRLGDRNE